CFILFCHCTLCLIILSSFSYCYADLRALHSFPTRRSSDLVQALVVVECVEEQALLEGCQGKDVLEGGCRGAGHVFQLLVRWGLCTWGNGRGWVHRGSWPSSSRRAIWSVPREIRGVEGAEPSAGSAGVGSRAMRASPAGVGWEKTSCTVTSKPFPEIFVISRRALMLSPPRRKKSSSVRTRSSPSTVVNASQIACS